MQICETVTRANAGDFAANPSTNARVTRCDSAGMMPPQRDCYKQAGHAKKLTPIIESLDRYDHDPEAWTKLRDSVALMTEGWENLIALAPGDGQQRSALAQQRDLCYDALRVQAGLFQSHRETCVRALRLQTSAHVNADDG